uniref:Ig-like domain-containing protein n=1 Tax=Scophthalmus maximus TaxID=52904 RepID=A0A8D3BZT4_SCOMX
MKGDRSPTEWSDVFTLTVSEKTHPGLQVTPSWLSPGASVTLTCSLEHPSAGWRFFWYKAVPKLPNSYYSYEMLPGSINGTTQDSYIVSGQTHTAGYVCRAGRGDPKSSSESNFVSPDRVQHFDSDSVSLSCEGNSTEWRVMTFDGRGYPSLCRTSPTATGPICKQNLWLSAAVYWCESGSGQFSSPVNISVHNDGIILESPVHPVAEGTSVTLGCRLKTENVSSNVLFYKNNKLVQHDTRRELTIAAVSKSHEGLYKCERTDSKQVWTSAESWMSVKSVSSESSAFPLPLTVGLVGGLSFIFLLLLLLLFCIRKSKGQTFSL